MENNIIQGNKSGLILFTIICNLALLLFAIYLWIEENSFNKQEIITFSGLTILPILNIFVLSKYISISFKNLSCVIVLYIKKISKALDDAVTTHINANIYLKGIFISLGVYTVIYFVFKFLTRTSVIFESSLLDAALYLFVFTVLVGSGFIAGRLAKSSGWLNGMIVGIGIPVINAIINDIFWAYDLLDIPAFGVFIRQLGFAVVCCWIGGYLADLRRRSH